MSKKFLGFVIDENNNGDITIQQSDGGFVVLYRDNKDARIADLFLYQLCKSILENEEDRDQVNRIFGKMADDLGKICEMLGGDTSDHAPSLVQSFIDENKA